jgi:hypothetical protein
MYQYILGNLPPPLGLSPVHPSIQLPSTLKIETEHFSGMVNICQSTYCDILLISLFFGDFYIIGMK